LNDIGLLHPSFLFDQGGADRDAWSCASARVEADDV
jgi:hypothetical protein